MDQIQAWCGPDSSLLWTRFKLGVDQIQACCGPDSSLVWARFKLVVDQIQAWCGPDSLCLIHFHYFAPLDCFCQVRSYLFHRIIERGGDARIDYMFTSHLKHIWSDCLYGHALECCHLPLLPVNTDNFVSSHVKLCKIHS